MTKKNTTSDNPLLLPFDTPYGTIPFGSIKEEHFKPAFLEAMRCHLEEINDIVDNPAPATFENTIVALDQSGAWLERVSAPFYALLGAETNDELQDISIDLSPLLSAHSNQIILNDKLFARITSVYQQRESLVLDVEQQTLLEDTYTDFVHDGATLSVEKKDKLKEINEKLSITRLTYSQNILKATNSYQLHITDRELLAGVPLDTLQLLNENAQKEGKDGWVILLKATSYTPVMTYADNRDIRRELYMAYATRCMKEGMYDNREHIKTIVNLRLEKAQLLGFDTYADYVLQRRMAKNQSNVTKLLDELLEAYTPVAEKEQETIQKFAYQRGAYFQLQAWDWAYYSEKLKKENYNLDNELLKPYFELENVKKGVFGLAQKLYGLTFVQNDTIPVYHPEVVAYEVRDEKGEFIAVFYADFHPREGKQGGAWMNSLKNQWKEKGENSRPHVINVMNFTRPTVDKPALLRFEELTTFLHEFGHGLHGMLANTTYRTLSGTNVYWDFVELPSQIMENWAVEKEFLDTFAIHYQTGEKIPTAYIDRIKSVANFNVGSACLRQLSFGLLDMAWHTLTLPFDGDVMTLEQEAMKPARLLPIVAQTAMSPAFSHIFSGGYAAGYYSYKWAEVLDADAYSLFQKNGIFDKKTAQSFRENILEKGGSQHPMTLYQQFRGKEPTIQAMLKRDGVEAHSHQSKKC